MLRVGRDREKHKRYPKGWAPAKSGVIYFRPTNRIDKETVRAITGGPLSVKLGIEDEAHASPAWQRIVAARIKVTDASPGHVSELVDRARRNYLPRILNAETRAWRSRHIDELEKFFGKMRYARTSQDAMRAPAGSTLLAIDVQRHIDENAAERPVAVNRAVQTWDAVFADARRRWGLTEYNPCHGVAYNPEAPRDVLPVDAEIRKVYRKLDPPMRFMVAMIRYFGRRRGELLKLTLASAQKDGLHLERGKAKAGRRSKRIIILWDPQLKRMWHRLMLWRDRVRRDGKLLTTAALLNRKGGRYTVTGFNSAWRRAQTRAGVRGNFTFHDIRATRASTLPVDQAVEVLAHDDRATTVEVYRRGPHIIDLHGDSRKVPENSRKRTG